MRIDNHRAACLIAGAGLGAVIRHLTVHTWAGTAALAGAGAATVIAGLLAGIALGAGPGRVPAFALGLAGGTASVGLYALLGVTTDFAAGVVFLIAVPLLTGAALTTGVVLAGRLACRDRAEAAT